MDWTNTEFWIALFEIIWVNLLLSGDNAVVIALAARQLPPQQQRVAVLGGSLGAVVLRVLLTLFALTLLQLPWLKLAGSLLLLYLGVQLLANEGADPSPRASPTTSVWAAVRTVLIADLVMSLDNVLAVAGAAGNAPTALRAPLLVIGLGLSIPLIVFGSTLLIKLMQRVPLIVTLGAALLGWVAGEMAVSDSGLRACLVELAPQILAWPPLGWTLKLAAAALVVLLGRWRAPKMSA